MHIYRINFCIIYLVTSLTCSKLIAQSSSDSLFKKVDAFAQKIQPDVIAWRRAIHQHPELGYSEFRTAVFIAEHLRAFGIEVKTGIAKTGVVGILKGDKPGPVVGLRADIDALPITEVNDLAFRSTDSTMYNGKMTGVSHACGHDSHVAMLLGTAKILASIKKDLQGTVVFIFQPAEEGPPPGEEGGAISMIAQHALDSPKVDVIFGQHISSGNAIGSFLYKPGSVSAENDIFKITVHGKQSHGASPWSGIDPIVTASQIVLGLQTIVSRNVKLTKDAAVVTVGSFNAGNRQNIIPADAVLTGTIRTLDTSTRNLIQRRMKEVVNGIASSAGATADVDISMEDAMMVNDTALTELSVKALKKISPDLILQEAEMGSEDFAYYAQKIPGFYFSTGALIPGKDPSTVGHHTPTFMIDESSFIYGVRALCYLTLNYMETKQQ